VTKADKKLLARYGVTRFNQPRLTPRHPTKKGGVVVRHKGQTKVIRFGAHGYPHNYSPEARRAFKARHAKNIKRGPLSAAYWSNKVLWAGPGKHKVTPTQAQARRAKMARKK